MLARSPYVSVAVGVNFTAIYSIYATATQLVSREHTQTCRHRRTNTHAAPHYYYYYGRRSVHPLMKKMRTHEALCLSIQRAQSVWCASIVRRGHLGKQLEAYAPACARARVPVMYARSRARRINRICVCVWVHRRVPESRTRHGALPRCEYGCSLLLYVFILCARVFFLRFYGHDECPKYSYKQGILLYWSCATRTHTQALA